MLFMLLLLLQTVQRLPVLLITLPCVYHWAGQASHLFILLIIMGLLITMMLSCYMYSMMYCRQTVPYLGISMIFRPEGLRGSLSLSVGKLRL